jgi:uncharacterized membrane protein YoaT (DUF817 family)
MLVVAAATIAAWPLTRGGWYVVLGVVPSLLFIWFPEQVDEYTFGAWRDGYRIDAHTPPVMIAVVGWILLLLDASFVLAPDFLARVFGVV